MSPATIFQIHLVLGYVPVAALLRRLYLAETQVDEPDRGASRHRYPA
jgi:hypothetical protein